VPHPGLVGVRVTTADLAMAQVLDLFRHYPELDR
jgi:hypothetical protein